MGGDLFFSDNNLNIVWNKVPSGSSFRISYLVMPELALNGPLQLGGKLYAVISAGKRIEVSVPVKNITIKKADASGSTEQIKPVEASGGDGDVVHFRIQVLSSSTRISDQELKQRIGMSFREKITIVPTGSVFKYQVGECTTYESAVSLLEMFKGSKASGAFIVAWQGNSQIDVEKAKLLVK
jgi:hypothetical protein